MSHEDQKSLQNLATQYLKADRSQEEIMSSLKGAGILDNKGRVKSPYTEIITLTK